MKKLTRSEYWRLTRLIARKRNSTSNTYNLSQQPSDKEIKCKPMDRFFVDL